MHSLLSEKMSQPGVNIGNDLIIADERSYVLRISNPEKCMYVHNDLELGNKRQYLHSYECGERSINEEKMRSLTGS